MPDLLLELFSEEIPARMQQKAAADLERLMNDRLLAGGFLPDGVKAFAGPRRLALIATGLPIRQPDLKQEKKGPRVGAPDKAIEGFLKSAGLSSLDQCEVVDDKKGQYYVAKIMEKGRDTAAFLAEAAPAIVKDFPWPKSMRWGDGDLKWVRPLHSVLCCFNDEIVPFEIGGVKSGDVTYGHRRFSSGPIHARNFDKYVPALTSAKVILDGEARAELILADARTLCQAQGLELVEDKGLLAEVAGLAEWPVVMMGAFDRKFLALPDEALTASMRGHQKYFSVKDPKTGRLANKFVFVANIDAQDAGKSMRAGYERVLTARLSDAWYLYHQDLKIPPETRVKDLDRVTFFEGLGSIGDKARRIAALAREIAPAVGADPDLAEKAARLAKADLTTGMVYEFPELQGLMGRYYYLAQHASPLSRETGEGDSAIADAIRDHYAPKGADDAVPTAPVTVAVALADKIDTLTAFFYIGKKPTGSGDPFALRRAALGVIGLLKDSGQSLNPMNLVGRLLRVHWNIPLTDARHQEIKSGLLEFFHDRMKVYFQGQGYRHDHVAAALIGDGGRLEAVPYQIARKLEALCAFLSTGDGANLAAGFKRAANILKAEEKKGALPGANAFSKASLEQAEEKTFHEKLLETEKSMKALVVSHQYTDAMTMLSTLRAPIDAFFEKVTVNADDAALRANRLALLQRFIAATATVADFSRIEG